MTQRIRSFGLVIIGVTIIALAFNLFLYPEKIIAGSTAGMATILTEYIEVNPGTIVFTLNVPILIWNYKYYRLVGSIKTLVAGLLLPVLIDYFENITPSSLHVFYNAILGGILSGIGVSLMYKADASTGGTAALAQIIHAMKGIDKGRILLILDGSIVLSGLLVYGLDQVFYSIICVISLTTTVTLIQTTTSRKFSSENSSRQIIIK